MQQRNLTFQNNIAVLGPIESPLSKIAGRYRWQILLKGGRVKILHQFSRTLVFQAKQQGKSSYVTTAIDVDPYVMM